MTQRAGGFRCLGLDVDDLCSMCFLRLVPSS